MPETLFKKLVIYFGLAILVCLTSLIISILLKNEPLIFISAFFIGIAILSLVVFISVFYSANKIFRKTIYFLIPACLVLLVIFAIIPRPADIPVIISGITAVTFFCIAVCVFNQKRTTLFLYILIGLIFFGIFMKRLHLPFTGLVLSLSSILFSLGIFMYGLTAFFNNQKNRFLSIFIPLCSAILMIFTMGAVFKIQHWIGGGILLKVSQAGMILVTIIALLTLPQSGYFNWSPAQRKLFYKNIVVPWIIAAFFVAYYFLIPQQTKETIFPPRWESGSHFNMRDYNIEQPDTSNTGNQ